MSWWSLLWIALAVGFALTMPFLYRLVRKPPPALEAIPRVDLRARKPASEAVVAWGLRACAYLSIITTVGIVVVLLVETLPFFQEVSLGDFLGDTQWTPLFAQKHWGIWPLLTGTLLTTLIAVVVAVPLGLLGAIYLAELAPARVRKILKPALELLAGVPTVVYGYFALTFLTPLLQKLFPEMGGANALSAGIVMGIMILPTIASLSEDAIYAVPQSLRENAYALGASRLKTIFKVILPSAFSGIGASVILGVSRAIGETMIVAIAAGQQPSTSWDPTKPTQTITAYIVQVSLGDTPTGTIEYRTIFVLGFTLFLITLGLNIFAQRLRKRVLKGAV
jgi:phosphate transport system permease protein